MRKKLPILLLVLIILLQAFVPVAYAASKNDAQSQIAYFCPSDATSEGAGKVEFKGKAVTQNNSLFDPKAVDKQGRTNIQRMEEGLAPIGKDGKSVNIHHVDQTNNGPVMEISGSSHQQGYSDLHQNTGQSPSLVNRNEFNRWRNDYWKWRSNDFK